MKLKAFFGGIAAAIKFVLGAIAVVGLIGLIIGLLVGMAVAM